MPRVVRSSSEQYASVITTRSFQDRLDTLQEVRKAAINVCCGGIVGLGETRADRVGFIYALTTLPQHPERVCRTLLILAHTIPQIRTIPPTAPTRAIGIFLDLSTRLALSGLGALLAGHSMAI